MQSDIQHRVLQPNDVVRAETFRQLARHRGRSGARQRRE